MSNMIPMLHPVSAETVQHYALNSGALARDVDFSNIKTAADFVAYFQANPGKLLGATSGTTSINEGREIWEPERNGRRIPYKGEKFSAGANPSIKANLVELTPDNIKLGSGAADIEGEGTTYVKVKPRAEFQEGDYLSNLVWFTNYGKKGIIMSILKNAICTTGTNWSIDDKKIATSALEFFGHADGPVFSDDLPIEYGILFNEASAAASNVEPEQTGQ